MDGTSTLHRLFDEQLCGTAFPEADKIVWISTLTAVDEATTNREIISSGFWLDPLRECRSYECSAHGDSH